jgi:hypothetical protein
MRLFNRKSQLERFLDTLSDSLAPSNLKDVQLPERGKALKAGAIAAGGLAALTAASAGISSLRRRADGDARGQHGT